MNTSWHSYPKIYALGHRALAELLLDNVLIEEKIDGSQISFGRFNGELKCRSKGADINIEQPEKMFALGVEVIKKLDLIDGWTYRAEYLQKPKHNTLAYDRIPKNHLIIFDVNTDEETYLPYEEKEKEASRIGLEVVPFLHNGKLSDQTQFAEMLESVSVLGGQKIEGVVVKNYHRFGTDKKALMGKYVSEHFKEVHGKEWKASNPSKLDVMESIIERLKTQARWNKAIQHLKEAGKLTDSPKDIGALIKEVQIDTLNEETDMIKEALFKYAKDHILRGVIRGLPEWYKQELMKKQFEVT